MSTNAAPDSWETQADSMSANNSPSQDADVTPKFSTLNVNAVEFVPSFAFSKSPADKQDESASSDVSEASPEHRILNGTNVESSEQVEVKNPPVIPPADGDASPGDGGTWEDVAEDDPIITPEGDEEEPSSEEAPIKIPKKKIIKQEVLGEKKEHVNVVFIGHVDAGKSTIGGQIMALTGMVDKRTLEKYEREAREKSRESWYLSWALDTNQEERDKGKTVEVGRAFFETDKKHFTILDAPGHKSFVPNMIGGAAQADLAVLVISARKGEFETGFDRGGQTREHAMLAKTAGVKYLVVLVNKMDDPTVNWDELRYNECKDKILPYLKKLGFNHNKDLFFLPCSGQTGQGLKEQLEEKLCPWYRGPAFIPFIDSLPSLNRKNDGPFIMPIVDKYKDMGTVLMGKVESGECRKGQSMVIMPNRTPVTVDMLLSDDDEVNRVVPGENVKIKVKGVEEEDVSPGFVLCDAINPIHTGRVFDAQLVILEHKSIICAGYSAVMHIHCAAEEVTVNALICLVDKKTGEKSKTRPRFVKQDQVAIMRIECAGVICLEPFKSMPQMGRFTLRDENKTIAIGKVLKLVE
ncbi:eukaryotic peptide chain release factor GTP-binding subunit ERF3A isoform X1 [Harmonia axyridis]|uniref:eukaryotic peptide chain release factor GTP-binding subunit ERF3A isoform X1 n=1 Tax=Harmonia axyridis TaxID=115357 RepID=UPI001E275FE7|nr:eukaryotic peptide chain release factor GTP-binding subunit ERF3A isoform X1 [Harmonia axyridis]